MKEEWKAIKDFDDYQISNTGKIRHYTKRYGWRTLKDTDSKGWYFSRVIKNSQGETKSIRLHRLVAEYFIGEIPEGYQVHHKDGNKQNNSVENLEIVTAWEHRAKTAEMMPELCKGMNNYNRYERPRRIQQYTVDGQFVAEFANSVIAEKYTGVCQRNILQVANKTPYKEGKVRNQAGGFIWKYADEGRGVAI